MSIAVWSSSILMKRSTWGVPSGGRLTRWNTAGVSWVQSPPPPPDWHNHPPAMVIAVCSVVFLQGMLKHPDVLLCLKTQECFHSTRTPTTTTTLKVNGENIKNVFLIRTAQIKMWLMPSLNKDYAGTSQRDECLNSFSLVALQWAQMSECWWSSNYVSGID